MLKKLFLWLADRKPEPEYKLSIAALYGMIDLYGLIPASIISYKLAKKQGLFQKITKAVQEKINEVSRMRDGVSVSGGEVTGEVREMRIRSERVPGIRAVAESICEKQQDNEER